jgi:hypothetical protein
MNQGIKDFFSDIPSCRQLRGIVLSDLDVTQYTTQKDKTAKLALCAVLLSLAATVAIVSTYGWLPFTRYLIALDAILLIIFICCYNDAEGYRLGCTPLSKTSLCVEVNNLTRISPLAKQYLDDVLASGRQLYAFDALAIFQLSWQETTAASLEDNRQACAELHSS